MEESFIRKVKLLYIKKNSIDLDIGGGYLVNVKSVLLGSDGAIRQWDP